MLDIYGKDTNNANSGEDSNNENDFSSLLTTPNLLAAGLLFPPMLLLVAIVRSRGGQRKRDRTLELQEATWGIQDDNWDSFDGPAAPPMPSKPVPSVPETQANDIYAAAQRIENQDLYGRPAYQSPQPVMRPAQNDALMNDLAESNTPQLPRASIDTSFLDDLL